MGVRIKVELLKVEKRGSRKQIRGNSYVLSILKQPHIVIETGNYFINIVPFCSIEPENWADFFVLYPQGTLK
jgi:hypothetical protein